MTPDEKFWQLYAVAGDFDAARDTMAHGLFGLQFRPSPPDSLPATALAFAERVNAAQRHFVERTRLGIPIIPFDEGLHGVMLPDATVYPQAIGLAATWDTALVSDVAARIARQARSRGLRLLLSPMINLAHDVRWGRTEESYGEDPFLAGAMAAAFVRPVELSGVVTTPKHFVANVGAGGRDSWPIDVDRRALEENDFVPFVAALRAGARGIMASYNSVSGAPASASRELLTTQLRERWGFGGIAISDAGAVGGAVVLHRTAADYPASGARAIAAGLDVIFQTSIAQAPLFRPAFLDRSLPDAAIDSAVIRVLRLKFALGLFEQPYVLPAEAERAARDTVAERLALDAARASLVLLRNERHTLPIAASARRIAVIGRDAIEGRYGGYSAPGHAKTTILDGLRAQFPRAALAFDSGVPRVETPFAVVPESALGDGLRASYWKDLAMRGAADVHRVDRRIDFSWPFAAPDTALAFGWYAARWEGTITAPKEAMRLGVDGNDGFRLWIDERLVVDQWPKASAHARFAATPLAAGSRHAIRLEYYENAGAGRVRLVWRPATPATRTADIARAAALARGADVAIVVAGIEEGEFHDRASLRLPGAQEALIDAVAATGRPVVVVLVGGSAVTMPWIDRVGAVLLAWYPGEAGGRAVAEALAGAISPSGRLPITFPLAEGQLPIGYRHAPTGRGDDYDDLTGKPLFPFGHGLGYAPVEYDSLTLRSSGRAGDAVTARFTLTNRGTMATDEVVQLYLRDDVASVARPQLMLAGFARVHLRAGEGRIVSIALPGDRFALLDAGMRRVVEPGRFTVLVGASSADLRLRATIDLR